jgi:CrcB protein
MAWIAVACGGALGALCRYAIMIYSASLAAHRFPVATLSVNILGSLLIGCVYVLVIEKMALPDHWRLILMAGFLGAFTTFSTFALEALLLWQNGHSYMAVGYIFTSLVCCLTAVTLGYQLTFRFF